MVPKLSAQKYNGTRGKADLVKKITEKLLKVKPDEVSAELVWAAYGLSQLTCGRHTVPNPKATNCKENPYCLGRLGLEKFEKLIKKSEELRNEKMVESERRDTLTQPCGLVNWANFCYVNSFLQIWFNDPVFRQIIYDWRPSDAYKTPAPPAMDVQQVMNALQHLFFTLDTSPYDDANGQEFCTALRLNQEQQDAQEFTVMFFDSIDRNLMKHPNGQAILERIAERFNGLQTSSLRCRCGHHSDNTTKFSALNLSIDGHNTLSAAIAGYFADERLSDFVCSGCGKRGGVKRETRINHLPPVLLLSLNRYVYDSTTGRRKKLKTHLQYPRLLNVDGLPHTEQLDEDESRYELSAVMVHEGDSAECGHYWDIIRHPNSGAWFKYNDKSVKETKAPGVETERTELPNKPNIDLKYCYGLVYRRREEFREPRPPPIEISGKWTKEMDHKFYRMTNTEAEASDFALNEVTQRFSVVGDHMAALEVKPDRANQKKARELAFLPTRLLTDIMATEYTRAVQMKEELEGIADHLDSTICEKEDEAMSSQCSESDANLSSPQKRKKNVRRRVKSMYDKRLEQVEIATSLSPATITLCPHDRIAFDSVLSGEVKAVNRPAAEKLIKDYGLAVNVVDVEGVARSDRLRTGLEVCTECVQDKTKDVHFTSRLEDDAALATKIAKEVNTRCSVKAFFKREPPKGSFYVAKSALGSFKKDAQRERQMANAARATSLSKWTIGPAEAARAAVGGGADQRKRRRGDREGAVERELTVSVEETEEPALKCARADSDEGMEEERAENGTMKDHAKEEVEEIIRDMIDELSPGPSTQPSHSTNSLNGQAADVAATAPTSPAAAGCAAPPASRSPAVRAAGAAALARWEKGSKEAAGRTRSATKEEVKEEQQKDEEMKEEEEENVKAANCKAAKEEGKREGKEGSTATDDSESPSTPAANGENGHEEGESNGRNGSSSNGDEEEADSQPIVFNDQLKCDHGGINVTEFRHMVSPEEWDRLSGYFESTFEVSTHKPVCEECKSFDANATANKQASSAVVRALNDAVGDILKVAEKRMTMELVMEGDVFTRGVCSRFVENARKVLNPRSKGKALPALCQKCLLCDHGRPRYGRVPMGDGGPFIVPLSLDEWTRLTTAWSEALDTVGGEDEDPFGLAEIELCPTSGSVSDQCTPCAEQLRSDIEAARYVYDNATIYVKLQSDEQPKEDREKGNGKGSKDGSKEGSEETPDITPLEIVTAPSNGGGRLVGAVTVGGRSSTRRGASKGLIKVRMSSLQTIKDLKIALLKHVNYSPIDQLLYSTVGGEQLDDELTLMEARVLPENYDTPIILIVQSGPDVLLSSPTNEKNRAVERGFYDTALAH